MTWVLTHLGAFPGVPMDAICSRVTEPTNGCMINIDILLQNIWLIVNEFIFVLFIVVIIAILPIVRYRNSVEEKGIQPLRMMLIGQPKPVSTEIMHMVFIMQPFGTRLLN